VVRGGNKWLRDQLHLAPGKPASIQS
jgi:hypothetical protein